MKPKVKTYPLNPSGLTTVEMPEGSQPLDMLRQSLVAMITTNERTVKRTFLVVHIGSDLPDDVYLDFVCRAHNLICFEVRTKEELRLPLAFSEADYERIRNLWPEKYEVPLPFSWLTKLIKGKNHVG